MIIIITFRRKIIWTRLKVVHQKQQKVQSIKYVFSLKTRRSVEGMEIIKRTGVTIFSSAMNEQNRKFRQLTATISSQPPPINNDK